MKTEDQDNEFMTIADCGVGGDCFEFCIGTQRMSIFADPGEKDSYEISFLRYDDDGGEYVVFEHIIPLTPEEYDGAMESSMEDFIFVDNVDSLVAKRVAKDILLFFLGTISSSSTFDDMSDRYKDDWAAYAKYLIHERMEGRTIADYEPGFEPEDNK